MFWIKAQVQIKTSRSFPRHQFLLFIIPSSQLLFYLPASFLPHFPLLPLLNSQKSLLLLLVLRLFFVLAWLNGSTVPDYFVWVQAWKNRADWRLSYDDSTLWSRDETYWWLFFLSHKLSDDPLHFSFFVAFDFVHRSLTLE